MAIRVPTLPRSPVYGRLSFKDEPFMSPWVLEMGPRYRPTAYEGEFELSKFDWCVWLGLARYRTDGAAGVYDTESWFVNAQRDVPVYVGAHRSGAVIIPGTEHPIW